MNRVRLQDKSACIGSIALAMLSAVVLFTGIDPGPGPNLPRAVQLPRV